MAEILNDEELRDRARDLTNLNGFDLVFVELDADPPNALIRAEFLNDIALANILNAFSGGTPATALFAIEGGQRRTGGTLPGQVQVTDIAAGAENSLLLTIAPIGDYSTYHLRAINDEFDPIFAAIPFKFRPGCFNLNCRAEPARVKPPGDTPVIDYLARDFHSFKHLMLGAMKERVPDWQPTSEADLDQVIINLLAARGDELADKQDRVANEAFFPRARKRLSLARHARLMDYHIHQGNQSSTWLALEVSNAFALDANFACWTGRINRGELYLYDTSELELASSRRLQPGLNRLALYTWGNVVSALETGSTAADVTMPGIAMTEVQAIDLRDLLHELGTPILLEEALNPDTGRATGRDQNVRQLLVITNAVTRFDPGAGAWMVRISWRSEDALKQRFCFVTRCPEQGLLGDVSLFFANLIRVNHGQPHLTLFTDPQRRPDSGTTAELDTIRTEFQNAYSFGRISEAHYVESKWGRLCTLPEGPLAYRNTPPGGEVAPISTTRVSVEGLARWEEQIDLVQSRESDNHFLIETDELARSNIRFGRAPNGEAPPPKSFVVAHYQTCNALAGNVGADTIIGFDTTAFPSVTRIWNPFDVTNGRRPENADIIRRRAPQAYRHRQLRAVTLNDYRRRAEELDFVDRASAAYAWTGSWRTVTITLDPSGSTELTNQQISQALHYLNQVRLIGEDIEIRPPDFVPLDISLEVCAAPHFWVEDVRAELEETFSEGYTGSGAPGFFHPDLWSFGQSLHASQIIERALAIEGVDRVVNVGMQVWDRPGGATTQTVAISPDELPTPAALKIDIKANQIIRVANDPNALEFGRIVITIKGGRR